MEDARLLEKIIRLLDVLIVLELDKASGPGGMRIADKISRLKGIGLSPAEISDIVGKPLNYITATLSQRRKKAKQGETK
jgi:hypothetical protein